MTLEGDKVLVRGAGGVGSLAVMMLNELGYTGNKKLRIN